MYLLQSFKHINITTYNNFIDMHRKHLIHTIISFNNQQNNFPKDIKWPKVLNCGLHATKIEF